jgi:hypothetical protein
MSQGVGPSLNLYLRNTLKEIRADEKYVVIEAWNVSKHGTNSDDAYATPVSLSSGANYFSGSVAWTRTQQRQDSAGGFYEVGDVTVVASKDDKNTVLGENTYLVVEGVSVRVSRVVDAADTNEIVIYCDRYQP